MHIMRALKNLLSEQHIIQMFYNIFRSLNYLHSDGIVFRDIKPANILGNSGNEFLDFGLSIRRQKDKFTVYEIQSGAFDRKINKRRVFTYMQYHHMQLQKGQASPWSSVTTENEQGFQTNKKFAPPPLAPHGHRPRAKKLDLKNNPSPISNSNLILLLSQNLIGFVCANEGPENETNSSLMTWLACSISLNCLLASLIIAYCMFNRTNYTRLQRQLYRQQTERLVERQVLVYLLEHQQQEPVADLEVQNQNFLVYNPPEP